MIFGHFDFVPILLPRTPHGESQNVQQEGDGDQVQVHKEPVDLQVLLQLRKRHQFRECERQVSRHQDHSVQSREAPREVGDGLRLPHDIREHGRSSEHLRDHLHVS